MNEAPIIPPGEVLPPMDSPPRKAEADDAKPGKPKRRKTGDTADRFAVLNSFVDCSMANLSRAELAAWFVLYRDTRNGTTRTSQADIARRAGADARTIRRALKRLVALGLVRIVKQGGFRKGVSVYAVEPLSTHPPAEAKHDRPEGGKSCRR